MSVERRGAAIEIAHLNKVYGSGSAALVALDDINLRVAPGEFLCVVGPSGCGKSTLLRILAGLDQQTGGRIDVQAAGWAVQNAMVFQDSGLFPWMRVAGNVGFGLYTRGVPAAAAAARVDAALKLVGLTKFRRHYPHQLSGGMRQRSAIARAFVTDPAMLLMDEPFAALDAQNRMILQAELVRLWEETRKTVIYVTHSIERLLYLISPIGLLAAWQLMLMAGFGDRRFIPAPSDIAVRFAQMVGSGELALHTAVTLWRIAAGYVIGAIPAVAVGLLMAMFRPVRLFFDPLIAALFPIPKVALMPLLLLAFGFGDASKIALVAIAR